MGYEKNEWPQLQGTNAEYAKRFILNDNPSLDVEILPQGSGVT